MYVGYDILLWLNRGYYKILEMRVVLYKDLRLVLCVKMNYFLFCYCFLYNFYIVISYGIVSRI